MNIIDNNALQSDSSNDVGRDEKDFPAEGGGWVFGFADMCIFAMYFMVFAWDKQRYSDLFAQG